MAAKARAGLYDSYESNIAMPLTELHLALLAAGNPELAARVRESEWDGTKEEANEWFQQKGRHLF